MSPHSACAAPPHPPAAPDAYPALRALVGPAAKVTTTRHFVVAYDTTQETVRQLTDRVEATYAGVARFCTFNEIAFHAPTAPLEILLFDDPQSFARYAATLGVHAEGLAGFYAPGTQRSAFFNVLNHPNLAEFRQEISRLEQEVARLSSRQFSPTEQADKDEALKRLHQYRKRRDRIVERLNRTVVQHETVHHLLFAAGVHVRNGPNPVWLVEGVACLFEPPPTGKGSGLGVTNQMRLADFRDACGENLSPDAPRPRTLKPEDLQQALASGRFLPLRRLVALDDLTEYGADSNLGYIYAEIWGLTFYLQRTHREAFVRYIAEVSGRGAGPPFAPEVELAQFEAAFGPLDAKFERDWAAFIFDLTFTPETADP